MTTRKSNAHASQHYLLKVMLNFYEILIVHLDFCEKKKFSMVTWWAETRQ